MSKIINLQEWKLERGLVKKPANAKPSRLGLWLFVFTMAMMPWGVYFLMFCVTDAKTPADIQTVKLLGALMAAIISPVITMFTAQVVMVEIKQEQRGLYEKT